MASALLLGACGHLGIDLDGEDGGKDSGSAQIKESDKDEDRLGDGGGAPLEERDGGRYVKAEKPPITRPGGDASVAEPPDKPRPKPVRDASTPPVEIGEDSSVPPGEEEPKRPRPPVILKDASTPAMPEDGGVVRPEEPEEPEDGGTTRPPSGRDGSVSAPKDAGEKLDADTPPTNGEQDAEPPVIGPKKQYCEPECSCTDEEECNLYCLSSPCWPSCKAGIDCKVSSGNAEVVDVQCTVGSVCTLHADTDAPVQFQCEGGGSCYADCHDAGSCAMVCKGSEKCALDCGSAERCILECGPNATCSMIPRKSDTETDISCAVGEPIRCANGVSVCNTECAAVGSVEVPL